MRIISRSISTTLSAGVFLTLFASQASAGCGDLSGLSGLFTFAQPAGNERPLAVPTAASPEARSGSSASIVGFWKFQLISAGNATHSPSIPDGALLDFGYTQWHSDGTEIQNSAGVPGGGFCLGVWGQTGYLTFELNHFPIAFASPTGGVANYINIRQQVTISPSGDAYTGTFTENVYDSKGNQVDHLTGNVVATRMTVDSTFPSAVPSN